jgi:hypothetical protein
LGWIEFRFTSKRRLVDEAWNWVKSILKVAEKWATVLAIGSSLTLLGTGEHGEITRFYPADDI